ncbi:MAG: outer membrane beta-barrel protein [bacterium]|nr:outer membrane beta-barrel protein [bacterium]
MRVKLTILIGILAVMLGAVDADAQFNKTWSDWYGHFGVSWVEPQGDLSDAAKSGWGLLGGATYKPKQWPVGILFEGGYTEFGMTRELLDVFEASNGDIEVWNLSTGLTWATNNKGKVNFHVSGSVGAYWVKAKLKEPTYVCGPVCPPPPWWCWWDCFPGSVVTDSYSSTEFGYSVAMGLDFKVGLSTTMYVEARYVDVGSNMKANYIPVVFGVRW